MNILAKNLLILASAGSGKTFQLANRIIALVALGIAPERIVALTFTRKAAGEFADSILTKLADAASDPDFAGRLRADLGIPGADFAAALREVTRALPKLTLGTMDSFFSRVVRGFQYELGLTGGKFDLLEGARAEAAKDELLAGILSRPLEDGSGDEFLHGFRRATIGREGVGVLASLRGFVDEWQGRFRTSGDLDWGPASLAAAALDDWEEQKHSLAAAVLRGLDSIEYTHATQRDAMEKMVSILESHTIGSGSLKDGNALLKSVLDACSGKGPLRVKSQKEFLIGGPAGDALRRMVLLAAHCEMAAALSRTRALRETVALVDAAAETAFRKRGLLGFDDVKILMGGWARDEDARLRREAVDFRLDAKYDHWLLDEFQDTSAADWAGLQPLVDEAATTDENTVFIVGDRKQAIYGWRGGKVTLFDEVAHRYSGGLETGTMAESWRSSPEVLSLVNLVCGDTATLADLFGPVAHRWTWETHFSAGPLADPSRRGASRVEVTGDWEARKSRMIELLGQLGAGRRSMSCGVLLRNNQKVREVADTLRAAGFDVIEEGRREPAKDNPVGIALSQLLQWLADPADTMAWGVIEMSPLSAVLRDRFGPAWQAIWEGLLGIASDHGFAAMIEDTIAPLWPAWSAFGKRRAGDIVGALAEFDSRGGGTPAEASDWIARLQVSQNPGIAAVQVMTIHKSKGLGFDIVVIPEIPNDVVPLPQYFTVAEGDGWLTQPPARWARQLIPEMRDAEERWADHQRYEAFCMLYVALTRAKRGLYVLLQPPARSSAGDKSSLANWLATSIGSTGETGFTWQHGDDDWVESIPLLVPATPAATPAALGAAVPRRDRRTATAQAARLFPTSISSRALGFGNDVHAAFEAIEWLDETPPPFPAGKTGDTVKATLQAPEVRALFTRAGRPVELLREQPVEAILDGQWLSGVIDRLHLHHDASGSVIHIEIVDFKTDTVETMEQLLDRHRTQMEAYRHVIGAAHPAAGVSAILVSTHLGGCIRF